mgnify:CR=1 FL=1
MPCCLDGSGGYCCLLFLFAANNFERNREDVFTVMGSDIGKLTEATVRLVGAASSCVG